jgi:hypothetical protein
MAPWWFCELHAAASGNRDAFQIGWIFLFFTVPAFSLAGPFVGWVLGRWIAGRVVGPPVIEGDEVRPIRIISVRATLIRTKKSMIVSDGRELWFQLGDLHLVATSSFEIGMPRQCLLKNLRQADDVLEFDFVAIAPKGHSTMKAIGTADERLRSFSTDYPDVKSIRVFDGNGGSVTGAING